MTFGDDCTDGADHAFCELVLSEDSWPAELQGGGHIAVNVGDNSPESLRSQ